MIIDFYTVIIVVKFLMKYWGKIINAAQQIMNNFKMFACAVLLIYSSLNLIYILNLKWMFYKRCLLIFKLIHKFLLHLLNVKLEL